MHALGTKAVWVLPNENPDNEARTKSWSSRLRPEAADALRDRPSTPSVRRSIDNIGVQGDRGDGP
jgi:hypothetical protein